MVFCIVIVGQMTVVADVRSSVVSPWVRVSCLGLGNDVVRPCYRSMGRIQIAGDRCRGWKLGKLESSDAIVNLMGWMEMKMEVVGSVGGDLLVMHA